MGRVTLNPVAHMDPIGTVVMPLLMMVMSSGFLLGWAKPVPFNPVNLKNIRRDPVLIAIAGPLSNLLLAVLSVVVLLGVVMVMGLEAVAGPVGDVLSGLIIINLVLMLFNILPIPPLDGHYVLHYFLPPKGQRVLENIGPFGIIIALLVVVNTNILGAPLQLLLGAVAQMTLWAAQ
jgi:Zn-dependent protease